MEPSDLAPLTSFGGPNIKLEDAVVSSATFLLWERLYSVATVSPTADRISLYCLLQQQKQRTDVPDGLCQRGDFSLRRPPSSAAEVSLHSGASGVTDWRAVAPGGSKVVSASSSAGALRHTRKEISVEGCISAALDGQFKDLKSTLARQESPSSIGRSGEHNSSLLKDDVEHRGQPLFLSTMGSAHAETHDKVFPLPTPSGTNTERTNLQVFVEGIQQEALIETKMKLDTTSEDTCLRRSQVSDVVKLGDDTDIDDGGDVVVRRSSGGVCRFSDTHQPSLPESIQLETSRSFKRSRWATSLEAQRLADEEILGNNVNCEEEYGHARPCELESQKGGNDEEEMIVENFAVLSDGRQEVFSSTGGSPGCVDGRSMSHSSSTRLQPQTFCGGTPARPASDTPVEDMSRAIELVAGEKPKKRARQYFPPVFYGNRARNSGGTAVGEPELPCSARASKSSSPVSAKLPEGGPVVCPTAVTVHSQCDDAGTLSLQPPLSSSLSPMPAPTMYPLQQVGVFSTPAMKSFFLSSSSEDDEEDGCEERHSPKTPPSSNHGYDSAKGSLSLDERGKEVSPQTSLQGTGGNNCPEQLQENFLEGETNEVLLSVSPPPSLNNYEWASKAQEVLEQQQKRCGARAPSTNPPSPPPLQAGGFELPQLPKGRRPAATSRCIVEEEKNNAEISHSVTKKRGRSCVASDSASVAMSNSVTPPPNKSPSQTSFLKRRAAPEEQPSGISGNTAAAKKSLRRAAVSPPIAETFPLPQTVANSESSKKKGRKQLKRSSRW